MPEKVYVKTPEEYLAAYHNRTTHVFLYYEGDKEELPVYLAQKSAEGDPYAMYLYSCHFFRLSAEHYIKKIHDRTLGKDEYGPKGFVYLRAAAEAGVPDAITEYEQRKQSYTYPIYTCSLPEWNPYNDYINEKLRYEQAQKEKNTKAMPLDYNDYINQKMQKLAAGKAMKKGQTQPSIPAAATKPATPKPTPAATKPATPKPTPAATKSAAPKPMPAVKKQTPTTQKEADTAKPTPATEKEKPSYTPQQLYNMGVALYRGEGVKQDYEKALWFYKKAAEQGVVFAMVNCGVCYQFGHGCEQDYYKAMEYYRAAADKGNAKAMWNLGCLEVAVCEHYDTGIRLMEKAFEQGIVDAAYDLGQVYSAKNPFFSVEKAAFWFERAAQAGNKKAYSQLGWLYQKKVETDDGKRKAVYWYKKAYENGDSSVCLMLGITLFELATSSEEHEEAYEWLRKAHLQGDPDAKQGMALMDESRCPHCRAIFSRTYKKGLFGERCVCSKCGKKIKEK